MIDGQDKQSLNKLTIDNLARNLFLSGLGVWELTVPSDDVDNAVMSVNDSFLSLFGDGTIGQSIGLRQFLGLFVHPEDYQNLLKSLDELLQNQDDYMELELRLMCLSRGDYRWVTFSGARVAERTEAESGGGDGAETGLASQASQAGQAGLGEEARLVGLVMDINNNRLARIALTDALKAKEEAGRALMSEQRRLSTVMDAVNVGVFSVDLISMEVEYSPNCAQILGRDLSEMGHTLSERDNLVLEADRGLTYKAVMDHCAGLTPYYESVTRMIHRDGSTVWVLDRGRVAEWEHDGRPIRLLGVMLNVTAQKKIEADLAARKGQMELFFKAADFGGWDYDVLGNKIEYTDIFLKMLGYDRDDLAGTFEEWLSLVHPDDREMIQNSIARLRKPNNDSLAYELRLKRKDGSYIWTYDVGRVMLRTDEGRAARVIGGNFDFTNRKKMEQELFEIAEQERKAHLARELAEESARSKSEFLANMSHEIRTPMNAIQGLTHLVLQTDLTDTQFEYLQRISTATAALLRIINDILDFSKIEAGKLEIEKTNFSLKNLVQTSMTLHQPQADAKGIELGLDFRDDLPVYLVGDQIRVGQILNNLLSNAIKFTQKGSVRLTVSLKESLGSQVVLLFSVKDSGIGLTAEQRGQLFRAFTQADASITRRYGGTGLGLTISKRLSEMMGGTIWCESQPGEGSTFSFTVILDIGREIGEETDRTVFNLKGLKTIVVDDNPTALEIIKAALVREGLEVAGFTSGQEALDHLNERREDVDLCLIDWKMPSMDGLETIRRIKQSGALKDSSVIVMVTAYDRDEVLGAAKELGVVQVLTKPVTSSHLHDVLMGLFKASPKVGRKGRKNTADLEKAMVKDIAGAKILLVEDNDVNQLVASKILGNAGFQVTIASDGQEAVEKVQANEYDLVLMDVQMPIMDGLTATKVIRGKGYKDLPIVAMTAHAMSNDRQLSLDAGMNDHVNKPINVSELFQTLVKWIPAKGQAKSGTKPNPGPGAKTAATGS
ncbi:MAG: response regulator [Deltaproteobacteria bacterium]|jgi:two-component system sensor histidine kinase/response regulator|nr:response regulator [Deltaproteobacteria bacterium]